MSNGPAERTGPDFRVPENLVRAYDAFVLAIAYILVDTGGKIWRCRFRPPTHVGFLLTLLASGLSALPVS